MNFSLSTRIPQTLLLGIGLVAPAMAQALTTFENGEVADATAVNANFNGLKTAVTAADTKATAADGKAVTADGKAVDAQNRVGLLEPLLANTPAGTTLAGVASTVSNLTGPVTSLTGALTVGSGSDVGLGISPTAKLHVNGAMKIQLANTLEFGAGVAGKQVDAGKIGYGAFGFAEALGIVGAGTTSANRKIKFFNEGGAEFVGNVSIGATSATPTNGAKLTVQGTGSFLNVPAHHTFNNSPTLASSGPAGVADISIYASNSILAAYYRATSDERIKNILGRSDAARDLDTLTDIEITDYTYKDVVTSGGRAQKKVIAQQVESVYPQAVSLSTNVVPDIYQRATHRDGWISLATDLKVGDRVRLIGENAEGVHGVLEVRDGAFRTGFVPAGEQVFVYGREVNDFRSVDYEAIAMLNVSATQELARQLKASDAKVLALESENDDLRQRLEALEAAVAELQPLLAARR